MLWKELEKVENIQNKGCYCIFSECVKLRLHLRQYRIELYLLLIYGGESSYKNLNEC